MSATQFTVDIRDLRFVMFEQLDIANALSSYERYADFDQATYETMLEEGIKIATEVIAPTNHDGDVKGCHFDGKGNVTTAPGFRQAWQTMAQGGWIGLAGDPAYGGMGAPHTLEAAVGEPLTGANSAFATYPGLGRGAANLLAEFAPDTFRALVCEKLYSGEWCGTMCLTEAGAGTSVGDNRARATPTGNPGEYTLEGEKVFITGGDHDLTENIVHLVLARVPGAPEGTKGLSIFLVPKFLFDADGALGARNGAWVESIEEKMGLHGSATTVLALGTRGECKGYLLGSEGDGMRIMFHMMNEARIGVGVQGLALAAAAYQNALSYARERIQGQAIENFGDASAPAVSIVRHPDVRRMLMWMKVHVETMRSLVLSTSLRMDMAMNTEDRETRKVLMGAVELMTPIIKAYCSDRGFDVNVLAVQTYGGYGYIGEYPVEQHLRDAKISSIYEGTNGVQAMDLLGRKMRMAGGMLFLNWLNEVNEEIDACQGIAALVPVVTGLERARDSLGAAAMHLGGMGMQGNLKGAMLQATPFLEQFGCVALGLEALKQARIAAGKLDAGAEPADLNFYRGKILNAQFYASNVLPRAVALGKSIQSGDESCMDEALFG